MTDELKQEITETFDKITPSEFTNPTMYDSLLKVYLACGEHGYQYAKKRLREVLGYELAFNVAEFDDGVTTESLVDKIFKRMEE